MSYILDALRRADAERERGTVPSLHTQQFGGLPGDDEAPPKPRLLIGAVVVLALALGGVLAWVLLGGSEPAPKPVVQAVTPAPTPLATPLPITGAMPTPTPTPMPPPTTVAAAPAVAPPVAASAPAPTPSSAPAARPTPRPPRPPAARRDASPTPAPAPAPAPATATTPATAAATDDRIYSFSELPESVRRELPKISYGGGSYSPDKASRLAFLNGQVFHEGDTLAPGLTVRQVKQKGVILAYKGYRFEIGP